MLRWEFDFADVQSVDGVLDEALPEDDGDEGGVGDSGADTDDDEGERRWLTPKTSPRCPCSPQVEAIVLDPDGDVEGFVGFRESADV